MSVPQLLGGRYRFERRLRGTARSVIWLAADSEGGETVVVSLLPPARVSGLEPAVGLSHPHLARIQRIIEQPSPDQMPEGVAEHRGLAAVVAEHVPGRTLHQRLENGRPEVFRAVQTITRVARALRAMHDKGAIHGALSPRSVIVTRAELGVVPVLTHLLAPPNGAYCSPDRVTGGGPSPADDAWALHATLYAALTGRPPFAGESRKELARMILAGRPVPLAGFDIVDPVLQRLIDRGLAPDAKRRATSVGATEAELLAWSRQHGSDSLPPRSQIPAREIRSQLPPSVDDVGIADAVLNPTSEEASRKVSTFTLPRVPAAPRPPIQDSENAAPPAIEVGRPSVDDHAEVLVALASQPPPSEAETAKGSRSESRDVTVDEQGHPRDGTPETVDDAPARVVEQQATATRESPTEVDTGASAARQEPRAAIAAPAEPRKATTRRSRAGGVGLWVAAAGGVVAAIAVGLLTLGRGGNGRNDASVAAPIATKSGPERPTRLAVGRPKSDTAPGPSARPRPSASTSTSLDGAAPAGESVGACVDSLFPAGTFKGDVGFDFVCDLEDPRKIERKLYSKVVAAGVGKLTDGMRIWSRLGWYQLAVVGVIREVCCAGRDPLKLPVGSGDCPRLEETLRSLGRATRTGRNVGARTDAFHKNVTCLYKKSQARPFRHKRRPDSGNRSAFEQFLSSRRASD